MQRAKARALLGQGKLCKGPGAENSLIYLRIIHHLCYPNSGFFAPLLFAPSFALCSLTLCSLTFPLLNSTGSTGGPPNSVPLCLPFLASALSNIPRTVGHAVILKILWGARSPLGLSVPTCTSFPEWKQWRTKGGQAGKLQWGPGG